MSRLSRRPCAPRTLDLDSLPLDIGRTRWKERGSVRQVSRDRAMSREEPKWLFKVRSRWSAAISSRTV